MARGSRLRRLSLSLAASVLALTLLPISPVATPAAAQSGDEQYFLTQMNALRQSRGLAPLAIDGNMASLAAGHTASMRASGQLYHAPSLSAGVSGPWAKLGENVGFGSYPELVWNAFVNSPAHYANLVDPSFTHVGISVMYDGAVLWTTHRFVARTGGGSVDEPPPAPRRAAPAPRPEPARAPDPVPEPEPPAPPPLPRPDPGRASTVLDVLHAATA